MFQLLFSCSNKKMSPLIIDEMGKDTSITIDSGRKNPSTLKIQVTGFSNDSFAVNNVIIHGGKVNEVFLLDWYDRILTIDYKKKKATAGNITIEYSLY